MWAFISGTPEADAGSSSTLPSARTAAAIWENIPGEPEAVYMFGGYIGGVPSRELWRYSRTTSSWGRLKGDDTTAANSFAIVNNTKSVRHTAEADTTPPRKELLATICAPSATKTIAAATAGVRFAAFSTLSSCLHQYFAMASVVLPYGSSMFSAWVL